LRRTRALGFGLEQSVPFEQLEGEPPTLLNPLEVLATCPSISSMARG